MRDGSLIGPLLAAALGLVLGGCAQSHVATADCGLGLGGAPTCDPGALRAALASARPGDVVRIGACTVPGPLDVPPDVTLVGSGRAASHVTAGVDGAIRVQGGASRTRVTCLGIDEAAGSAAIRADGPGNVVLDALEVHVERGVGIQALDLATLSVDDVRLEGPVTRDNAADFPSTPTAMETATVGISIARIENATISGLEVTGFADFAIGVSESSSTWRATEVHDTLGTAMAVSGGFATIEDAAIHDVLGGARLLPAYGLVIAMEATVGTTGMAIERSEGYGVLQDSSTATHQSLSVIGCGEAGVWAQRSSSFVLDGADLRQNGGAGIALFEVDRARLSGASISGTQMRPRVCELRAGQVGDGLQMRAVPDAQISMLTSRDNARVGVLLQVLADGSALPTFTRVAVGGTGMQLGAVAVDSRGRVVSPDGWDDGIVREGVTATNDAIAIGTTVGPPCAM